ncbi:MAG: restriction endonuclease subunit S [Bacteroidaceae bacterium]|nr:restriction endonuclease subunit S [Bacteroidaceae bacterium]
MEYENLKECAKYSSLRTSRITLDTYVSTENMLPNKGGITTIDSIPDCKTVSKYEPTDILISNIRPYFCKIWYATREGGCSNDVLVIKANKNIDSKFLYYVLSDNNFFNYDTVTSKGTKMPRGNKNAIMKYLVPKIELQTQKKIASILSAYDSLIENNTKRIKLLEQMAENLYKEWFVRFRFPGHENMKMENGLPMGWKVKKLSDIATYSTTKVKSENIDFYISTENMLKDFGGIDKNTQTEIPEGNVTKVHLNDILVSNIRPYFKKIWLANKEAGCSNDVLNIRANEGIDPVFLYHSIRKDSFFEHMVAGSNGTKMPRGNKDFTMKYQITVPDGFIMERFSSIAQNIKRQMLNLLYQNTLLARQRDLLLPRLMSGKLEVKP